MIADNYAATIRALIRYVLDHAPAGIRERDIVRLRRDLEGSDEGLDRTLYLDFVREEQHAEANFSVGFDHFSAGREMFVDEEGNRWLRSMIDAKVNYPAYGSASSAVVLRRAELIREVALFAAAIESRFPDPVYRLIQSRAERDAAAEEERKREEQRRVFLAVSEFVKGLRVGKAQTFNKEDHGVVGKHEVSIAKRTYSVEATSPVTLVVERTA